MENGKGRMEIGDWRLGNGKGKMEIGYWRLENGEWRLGNGHLYSFDQDIEALENAIEDERWTFVHSNFRYLRNWMDYYGVEQIDGLLADLGVSFHHFDCPERGFSFRFSAPLDMRMNQTAKRTAADIVNSYSEEELAQIFRVALRKIGRGRAFFRNRDGEACRA